MKPQSQQLKKLQKTWYAKLKKLGFDDIEQSNGKLKEWSTSRFLPSRNNDLSSEQIALANQAKEQYYRIAGQFLYDHKFDNKIEKFIWEKHAEGNSFVTISMMLKEKGVKLRATAVDTRINKLKAIMLAGTTDNE